MTKKTKRFYRSSRGEINNWRKLYLESESINPKKSDYDLQEDHPFECIQVSITTSRAEMIMGRSPIAGRFDRLKRFLHTQIPSSYNLDQKDKANYEINLSGNKGNICINVDSVDDFSFSSLWEEYEFNAIYITHTQRKNWPKRELKEVIELIDSDIEFDGYEPDNVYEVEGNVLSVDYEIKDYWERW